VPNGPRARANGHSLSGSLFIVDIARLFENKHVPRPRNQRPTNVDYYCRNREQEIFRVRARQHGTTEMLREWRQVPCADCGGRFEPHQMDFDHRDPSSKLFNLAAGRAMLMSTSKLRAEADKCDVVCANCHRLRTRQRWVGKPRKGRYGSPSAQRNVARWTRRTELLAKLRAVPCADCGGRYPFAAMDFDHRDPTTKQFTVSRMHIQRTTEEEIFAEVAKCDVVCANCHRLRTYRRREERTIERE
jgi:formate-dependent nitrite reductase cytochrome c552 subunit